MEMRDWGVVTTEHLVWGIMERKRFDRVLGMDLTNFISQSTSKEGSFGSSYPNAKS